LAVNFLSSLSSLSSVVITERSLICVIRAICVILRQPFDKLRACPDEGRGDSSGQVCGSATTMMRANSRKHTRGSQPKACRAPPFRHSSEMSASSFNLTQQLRPALPCQPSVPVFTLDLPGRQIHRHLPESLQQLQKHPHPLTAGQASVEDRLLACTRMRGKKVSYRGHRPTTISAQASL
jgi:hypothetical protein